MDSEVFEKLWSDLKTQRDELRVQVHLAKAELKDEWDLVEKKVEKAQVKVDQLKNGTEEVAEDAVQMLGIVAEEVTQAYQRIRDRIGENGNKS